MDFRAAVEHARQASAAVQRWLESQGKCNDPYQLMTQVMQQRVEITTQLVKNVTRDLESLDLDFDMPGLPVLNAAVRTLADRWKNCFPADHPSQKPKIAVMPATSITSPDSSCC